MHPGCWSANLLVYHCDFSLLNTDCSVERNDRIFCFSVNSSLFRMNLILCLTPCINHFHSLLFLFQSMKAAVVSESGAPVLHYAVSTKCACVCAESTVFLQVCASVWSYAGTFKQNVYVCVFPRHDIVIHSLFLWWIDTGTHTKVRL